MSASRPHPRPATRILLLEEGVVTAGGQFREVALALLMVAMWPSPRSYALALLVTLLPRAVAGRWLGRRVGRLRPRPVLACSYLARAAAVAGLLWAPSLAAVVASLFVLALGTAAWVPAIAPYQGGDTQDQAVSLVRRLRMVAAGGQAVLPLLAGLSLGAGGRGLGFGVSLAAYLAAAALMTALPARPAPGVHGTQAPSAGAALPAGVRRQMLVVALANALGWIANMLYVAYLLVDLRVGPARYGLALALWGGAGLASGWLLGRSGPQRLDRWSWLGLVAMAGAWAVMTRPVGYWPTALLGLPEGFATWLIFDLLQAHVLGQAPAPRRGEWAAAAAAWGAGGRMAGLVAVLVLPVFTRVHLGFGLIAAVMAPAAAAVALAVRRENPDRALPA